MSLKKEWYCARGEKRSGALTTNQMLAAIQVGKLRGDDLVWKEGLAEWNRADSFPVLFPKELPVIPAPSPKPPDASKDQREFPGPFINGVGSFFIAGAALGRWYGERIFIIYLLIGLPLLLITVVLHVWSRRSRPPQNPL